ncbi:hypothetical protein OG500_20455 [Kitasatospora sp. NBC_01250]|nr:hypothetical protein [Kitasatospora sp. NBC_01250]
MTSTARAPLRASASTRRPSPSTGMPSTASPELRMKSRWPGWLGSSTATRSRPRAFSTWQSSASPWAKPLVTITSVAATRTPRTRPRWPARTWRSSGWPAVGP